MAEDIDGGARERRGGASGHCAMPHTADTLLHAWGPSRERCLAEAVHALVETFAEVADARPVTEGRVRLGPADDEELLVALLDEVVFRLEVAGLVPVGVEVEPVGAGVLEARLSLARLADVTVVGAAPKGVSWQDLRIGPDAHGWSCAVIVDV
ncbi:archease [Streptomyces sp. NPDC001606]